METMIEILEFISTDTFKAYMAAIGGIITAASVLTALTPTKTDDKIIGFILKALNVIALNVGKNKNADDI